MSRYLVTGGAGFIGSHTARNLLSAGHDVCIVDDLSTGYRDNVPEGCEYIEADISNPKTLELLKGEFAGVIHLAAQSSGAIGQKDPQRDLAINVGATLMLSRWCLAKGIQRFIFTSSMTAYGKIVSDGPNEEAQCRPISYYGAAKLAAENYLRLAMDEGLSVTVLRPFNVYGPGQNLANLQQGMVSIYLAYMLKGERVPVTGSLDRYRDFIYIDDVVEAIVRCVSVAKTPSFVYNLGSGTKVTVKDLINGLIGAMDLPTDYPVDELEGSPHDLWGSYGNMSRMVEDLGWKPAYDLSQGLNVMVDWAKRQRN